MNALTWARGAFFILLSAVTYLTVTPNPDDVKSGFDLADWIATLVFGGPEFGDKVAHFGAYSALGAVAAPARFTIARRGWPIIPALGCFGVLLEGVQGLSGVRQPDALDALANLFGASAGFVSASLAGRMLHRRLPA